MIPWGQWEADIGEYGGLLDPKSIPEEFLNIPEVKEALETLTVMSSDPVTITRAEYNARVKELNDIYAGQSVKYEEGLEKGEKLAKIESARKMLQKGFDISDIAEISGLSVEEIKELK